MRDLFAALVALALLATAASLATLSKVQQQQAQSLDAIKRLIADQPKAIGVAVADAVQLSPRGRVA